MIKFSPATDVYALAATMYFMLTATTPPNANDRQQCLEEGRELLNIPMSLSENVRNAISWGMNISRKERLQNTDEFIQAINGNLENEVTRFEDNDDSTKAIEMLIGNKQYKEAYKLCVKSIRNKENVNYARQKVEELLPIINNETKRNNRKQTLIAILFFIVVIITLLILSYQLSQH